MNDITRTSKEVVTRLRAILETHPERGFTSMLVGDSDMKLLLDAADRAAHEPFSAPPTAEHLANFSDWLNIEMPAGTIIGNQNWWARKLLNAAYVTARERAAQPPVPDQHDWRFMVQTLEECQNRLQAKDGGARHSWMDPALDIARARAGSVPTKGENHG